MPPLIPVCVVYLPEPNINQLYFFSTFIPTNPLMITEINESINDNNHGILLDAFIH